MEHGAVPEQRQSSAGERVFSGTGNGELIDRFYETEGDSAIGEELSIRILEHGGFADDPWTTPLIGRDGDQVVDEDRPFVLKDYVNYAAKHHFSAIEGILGFLMMVPGEQDFEDARSSIQERLNAGKA